MLRPTQDFILFKIKGIDKSNLIIGYERTDRVLAQARDRIRRRAKAIHFIRLSGSRLAAKVPATAGLKDLAALMIQDAEEPYFIDDRVIRLTLAAIIVPARFGGFKSMNMLLHLTEIASYEATKKTRIRGAVIELSQAMLDEFSTEEQVFHDLRLAIQNQQFFMEYQPLIGITNRLGEYRTVGLEALIRWQHPTRGIIYPGMFIPIAEEFNLIHDISRIVISLTLQQLHQWQRFGIYLSINFSARDLYDPNLVGYLKDAIADHSINPEQLAIEITETASLDIGDVGLRHVVDILKLTGVRLALDDFGTGFNTLNMLSMPFDILKIDRSYVSGHPKDLPVCDFITALAHCRGKKVVAEGVETLAQIQAMVDYHVDVCQGYYFSKPLCPEAVTARLLQEQDFRHTNHRSDR